MSQSSTGSPACDPERLNAPDDRNLLSLRCTEHFQKRVGPLRQSHRHVSGRSRTLLHSRLVAGLMRAISATRTIDGILKQLTRLRHLLCGKDSLGLELPAQGRKHLACNRLSHEKTASGLASEFDDHATLTSMRRICILAPRRLTASVAGVLVIPLMLLAGCSPRMDWRELGNETAGWRATFPAKPVEVSRQIELPNGLGPVRLTLRSARVEDAMFAVGWAESSVPGVREALESAMLANIGADAQSIQRKTIETAGQQLIEVSASGRMQLSAHGPPTPARLVMRSTVVTDSGSNPKASSDSQTGMRIVEIIAVGPTAQISDEEARQFVESLRLSGSTALR